MNTKQVPSIFKKIEQMPVEALIRKAYDIYSGTEVGIRREFGIYNVLRGNSLYDENTRMKLVDFPAGISVLDDNGEIWIADLGFSFDTENKQDPFSAADVRTTIVHPRQKKGALPADYRRMYSSEEAESVVRDKYPHAYKMMKDNGWEQWSLVISAPYIEQLASAGYTFAKKMLRPYGYNYMNKTSADAFNRLCRPGTSPQTIFTVPRCLFTKMKEEDDVIIWDAVRKMVKNGISYEDAGYIYDMFKDAPDKKKMFPLVRKIMQSEYAGKRTFSSWKKLSAYFNRIDMYEAIDVREGVQLLSDYLDMCRSLGIKPRIDSDSLKREHDVTARICRQKAKEMERVDMKKACVKLRRYDYAEKTFFIRGIRDYDDLMDEAEQQRNCVAVYAESIARGRRQVYTMRETRHPEKSLITVELGNNYQILQAYLSCNRVITNSSQKAFLQRWIREIKRPDFVPSEIGTTEAAAC